MDRDRRSLPPAKSGAKRTGKKERKSNKKKEEKREKGDIPTRPCQIQGSGKVGKLTKKSEKARGGGR